MLKLKAYSAFELVLFLIGLAFFVSIVFAAIQPSEAELTSIRNSKRKVDLDSLLIATYRYAFEHNGQIPLKLDKQQKEVCRLEGQACQDLIDFSLLIKLNYISEVPVDPLIKTGPSSGYTMMLSEGNRIIAAALHAEGNKQIFVVR